MIITEEEFIEAQNDAVDKYEEIKINDYIFVDFLKPYEGKVLIQKREGFVTEKYGDTDETKKLDYGIYFSVSKFRRSFTAGMNVITKIITQETHPEY